MESDRPETTTIYIPSKVLCRLMELHLTDNEAPYMIIERLLDEHDLKTMQKVVLKRVR